MNILFVLFIVFISVGGSKKKSIMPLLSHIRTPLVAELDMADVNSQLKTFILTTVRDEIDKTVSGNINETIQISMSKVESLLKKEFSELKRKMLHHQKHLESTIGINDTNRFEKIKEKIDGEITKSIKGMETRFSELLENSKREIMQIKGTIKELPDETKGVVKAGCADISKSQKSGVYQILNGYDVYCEMDTDGGGWTVIQRRIDGKVDFYRNWETYKDGFGDLKTEFWLGNEKIHQLTSRGKYELRIDLEDFDGNKAFAKYSSFSIEDESSKYQLSISGYSGNAGDSFTYHNGGKFSTKDDDNDINSSRNCAVEHKGAWWHKFCNNSNLNGKYVGNKVDSKGLCWWHWKKNQSMKTVTIMIRKTD